MGGELQRTDVGDLTFDVRVDGPEDGRPVLLLHGFPQTSASWAAASTSDRVASGFPKAMLSAIVPLNRNASCGTIPSCRLSDSCVTERRSCPSTRTAPRVG